MAGSCQTWLCENKINGNNYRDMKRMLRAIAVGVSLSLGAFSLYAQKSQADQFYKFGAFDQALTIYLEEHKQDPLNAELNYRIGYCYLETSIDKKKSIPYLEFAMGQGYDDTEIYLEMGQAYMHAHRFGEALEQMEEYKRKVAKDADKTTIADKYISFCNNAKNLTANPLNVSFVNLGKKINDTKADFNPRISYKEDEIVFATNRRYISEFAEYVHDVYWAKLGSLGWKRPSSISARVNTIDNEFFVGASPDLTYLLYRPDTYEEYGDLFMLEKDGKRYGDPKKLEGAVNQPKSTESTGCLTLSGDTLYFSSDREGGFGGYDLYMSLRMGDKWGEPQNLGPNINTPYNEEYPVISEDGKTMYFASEGHNSMGGYDIFISKKGSLDWGKPDNFGYPINTTYDDYGIGWSSKGRYGYVAAVRDEGFGDYDLYKVVFNDEDAYFHTYKVSLMIGSKEQSSKLSDATTDVKITIKDVENDEIFGEYIMNQKESYFIYAVPAGHYELIVKASGMNPYKKNFTIDEEIPSRDIFTETLYLNYTVPPAPKKPTRQRKPVPKK